MIAKTNNDINHEIYPLFERKMRKGIEQTLELTKNSSLEGKAAEILNSHFLKRGGLHSLFEFEPSGSSDRDTREFKKWHENEEGSWL